MKYPIKINPNCHNQVETINGSVVCGVYQIINGIKHIWLCDKCHNSPMEIEDEKLTSSIREEKLIILETSLLLILADNEFHPQEKKFIETLVKEFQLESEDFALLYYILPEEVKKYIVKERIHETLEIDDAEIAALEKFTAHEEPGETVNHEKVYVHFVNSWKNRSTRYKRGSVY